MTGMKGIIWDGWDHLNKRLYAKCPKICKNIGKVFVSVNQENIYVVLRFIKSFETLTSTSAYVFRYTRILNLYCAFMSLCWHQVCLFSITVFNLSLLQSYWSSVDKCLWCGSQNISFQICKVSFYLLFLKSNFTNFAA